MLAQNLLVSWSWASDERAVLLDLHGIAAISIPEKILVGKKKKKTMCNEKRVCVE